MDLSVRTYRNVTADGLTVQLRRDNRVVEAFIPDEEIVATRSTLLLFESYLLGLACQWLMKYDQEVRIIRPTQENEPFRAVFVGGVIEGEIIPERKQIGA